MANEKTVLDEIVLKDLEDNSKLTVTVLKCTELGNESKPGLQAIYMGYIVNFEPLIVERWAYQASKEKQKVYFLKDSSWTAHEDQYVKVFLVNSNPPKAKVEVKTRSSKPVSKEYALPFKVG